MFFDRTEGRHGRAGTILRRILPKTLLGRSLLIIVTPLILIQVVMAFIFYDSHWYRTTETIAAAIAGDVALIAEHFSRYPGEPDQAWISAQAMERMDLQVLYRDGETISSEPAFVSKWTAPYFLTAALDDLVPWPYRIDGRLYPREVYIDIQVPTGVLRIIVPKGRFASTNTYLFVLWMGGTTLILLFLAIVFMNGQVRPLRRLARAADDFGKGRDDPGFRLAGAAEVRQAAAAFLKMKERILRQISQRTELLAGVSHDLRTPLTRMKLQLAMLGDGAEIDDLRSDVQEMETMVESYLSFARGEGAEETEETDLAALLRETVGAARRDGSTVRLSTESQLTMPVRPVAIRRTVNNLIGNAQRYARNIEVHARRLNGMIEIAIDDDGPGIPPGELDSVFKPFYRLEPSRNRETGGAGLGLTIARDVVRGHGGDIRLSSSPLGGLRATITLPL